MLYCREHISGSLSQNEYFTAHEGFQSAASIRTHPFETYTDENYFAILFFGVI